MRIFASLVFLCSLFLTNSPCKAQTSRVDGYEVTTFQDTWDSLSIETATSAQYEGGTNEGKYAIQLPFDFPFDGGVVPHGTMIGVGANGAISLVNAAIPGQQLIGDMAHPMLIGPFNGDIKQGSDRSAGVADTLGLYQMAGVAPNRVLTIEYPAFHLRGGGSGGGSVDTLTSMQVKLYETTGIIEFIYRDHGLELPSNRQPPPLISIGLNGSLLPEFRSKTFARDTRTIPATDLRWTPGTASVDRTDEEVLQAYPNPTSNWLHVTLRNGETAKKVTVSDGRGRIHSLTCSDGGRIDVSALESGSYLLKLQTNLRSYVKRLTVIR